ncbi:MAG: TA system VapC family ribonuclease toxin [Burkholderiales bacterium]
MSGRLVDTNVWVAAVFPIHPGHAAAQSVLEQATPDSPAVFCRSTQISFLRLVSTQTLQVAYGAVGLTNRDAIAALTALLALPGVLELPEATKTRDTWLRLAAGGDASPKVWMDAYLAAFAVRAGLSLVTFDGGFRNFAAAGLEVELLQA